MSRAICSSCVKTALHAIALADLRDAAKRIVARRCVPAARSFHARGSLRVAQTDMSTQFFVEIGVELPACGRERQSG